MASQLAIPGITINPHKIEQGISKFDLTLTVIENGNRLLLDFEYLTVLFKRETIEKFVGYFREIVSAVVKDADMKITDIPLLTKTEQQQLLYTFNNTQAAYPKNTTLVRLFEEQVERVPGHIALTFDGKHLTYTEINTAANQLAADIIEKGSKKGDIIGIMIPRSFEMIIAILGVLKAGCAYVPIDPEYPADRLQHIAEDSGLTLLLTKKEVQHARYSTVAKHSIMSIAIEELLQGENVNRSSGGTSSDLAYLIYTSGSTGKPKGVMIGHKNVINFVYGITGRIDFTGGDTMLCLTTVSFDIFVLEVFVPLLTGRRIVLASAAEQKDPPALAALISRQRVDFMQITPSHLKLLLSGTNNEDVLSRIKLLMVGGEIFPDDLLKVLKNRCEARIYNMYGPTETTVWSTISEVTRSPAINIGTPIANTVVRILGKNNELLPIGTAGELCIGGDGVSSGYWKNPALTAMQFVPDPYGTGQLLYRTGDLARWLPDGKINCMGRLDQQVKIRGFRIEPGEIESQLSTHGMIQEVVVVVKERAGDKFLTAYYTSAAEPSHADLIAYLSARLPAYMVPTYYMQLKEIPLTPNGKTDRKTLPEPGLAGRDNYVPPSGHTQEILVQIWSGLLGIDPQLISTHRNFFEIGGHSLKATLLVNKIFKELNVEVPVKDIFELNTIVRISDYIENRRWIKEEIASTLYQGDEFII